MFMIIAVIQPVQLPCVRAELILAGVNGMTISQCAGHGRKPRMIPGLKGGPDVGYLEDNVQIEVAVCEAARERAIDAIVRGARFAEHGGGKIFVAAVERVVSIRTGEEDELALDAPLETPAPIWTEAAE